MSAPTGFRRRPRQAPRASDFFVRVWNAKKFISPGSPTYPASAAVCRPLFRRIPHRAHCAPQRTSAAPDALQGNDSWAIQGESLMRPRVGPWAVDHRADRGIVPAAFPVQATNGEVSVDSTWRRECGAGLRTIHSTGRETFAIARKPSPNT